MKRQGGDDIEENFFEHETDVENIRTGGAYDSGSESELEATLTATEVATLEEKKGKKRRKLAELKQAIANKRQRDTGVEEGDTFVAPTGEIKQFTSSNDQWTMFMDKQPVDKHSGKLLCLLEPTHFLENAPINGSSPDAPCAFTDAVNAASVRKQIREASVSGEMGCPVILVLSASTLRVSHICNRMKGLLHCPHIKLFAKHFKVQEQVEQLGKERYPVAVGTPNRVMRLFELGALSNKSLRLVIIDNALDAKQFTALTMNGVREDLYALLGSTVQARCMLGLCKVALVGTGTNAVEREPGKAKALPKNMATGVRKGF